MQIKYRNWIVILNSFWLLTIFANDSFLKNISKLSLAKNGMSLTSTIAELSVPMIVYAANLCIIVFALNNEARLKIIWLKVNTTLNLLAIVLVLPLMFLPFVMSTPKGVGFTMLITVIVVSIVPVINLLSLNNFSNKINDVEQKIGENGFNLLMAKSIFNDVEQVELLLSKGVAINEADENGYTALMYAASNGCYESCEMLIEAGADKNIKTIKGNTALDFATKNGHGKVMTLLISDIK